MLATARYRLALRAAYRRLAEVELRTDGGGCPDCGGPIRREGRCETCTACGRSTCGGGR